MESGFFCFLAEYKKVAEYYGVVRKPYGDLNLYC